MCIIKGLKALERKEQVFHVSRYIQIGRASSINHRRQSGLGFAIAKALGEAGASVVITSRQEDRATKSATHLAEITGQRSMGIAVDVIDTAQIESMIQSVVKKFGRIDILVNNAGINIRKPVEELDEASWDLVQDTNLKAPFLCSRAAARFMKKQRYGRIINLSSMLGQVALPQRSAYYSSKSGLIQLTRVLALEWASFNITVNALCPGPFATELNIPVMNNPQTNQFFLNHIAPGRWGQPDEPGGAIVFLASGASSFMTGAALVIGGGWTADSRLYSRYFRKPVLRSPLTLDLSGKTALITGSSRGLGRHYALHLARVGADVIIHDVSESAAAEFGEAASGPAVAEEIRTPGRKSSYFSADLTDPLQVEKLLRQTLNEFDHIDILVNNAGGDIGARTPRPDPNDAIDIDPADIRAVVDRNLLTTLYTCKYGGMHMRERGSGKIINVGSIAGHIPTQTGIIYAAAKTAITHYTRCLAEELRPFGVNVNCIAPSPTYTGRFLATRTVDSQQGLSRLQQVTKPEEIAQILLFLAGPQSDALTGETIVCWI